MVTTQIDQPLARQSYGLLPTTFFCQLVLTARTSMHAAVRVMELTAELLHLSMEAPHMTTGRYWLLLGYFKLHRPKTKADDWVWLADHTNQIGQEKCLAVVGVRLSELPPVGECLQLEDLEPIDLAPVTKSDGHVVYEQLEANVAKTGVPRAILGDHGSDLLGGVKRFCQVHPETANLYDISHKAARLLKARLERDDRWARFCTQVGQTKLQTQQTELAFLVPPNQRSKARYMNLGRLLNWGNDTRKMPQSPPAEVVAHCTVERLEEKFGWLREYDEALQEWSEYQGLLEKSVDFIRRRGYSTDASRELSVRLMPQVRTDAGQTLADELVTFVQKESSQARPGERLPGSTEVLESSFGKLKSLEGDQNKGGFTTFLLTYAALLSKTTPQIIKQALESTPLKLAKTWCSTRLGQTVKSKNILARRAAQTDLSATDTG